MIDKKRYTVEHPPRVHELARATGMSSPQVITWLYVYNHEIYRTASHKVPLRIALGFMTWIRSQYVKNVRAI